MRHAFDVSALKQAVEAPLTSGADVVGGAPDLSPRPLRSDLERLEKIRARMVLRSNEMEV